MAGGEGWDFCRKQQLRQLLSGFIPFISVQSRWADPGDLGVAAVKVAIDLGPGHRVVTILCDSGTRHLSKFWNEVDAVGGEEMMDLRDVLG